MSLKKLKKKIQMKLPSIPFSVHHTGHYLVESNCREIVGPIGIYEN